MLCSSGFRVARKSNKVKRRLAVGQAPDLQPLASARRIPCVLAAARSVTSHCTRRIVCNARCTKPSPAHPHPPIHLSTSNVATLPSTCARAHARKKTAARTIIIGDLVPSCLLQTAGWRVTIVRRVIFSSRRISRTRTSRGRLTKLFPITRTIFGKCSELEIIAFGCIFFFFT